MAKKRNFLFNIQMFEMIMIFICFFNVVNLLLSEEKIENNKTINKSNDFEKNEKVELNFDWNAIQNQVIEHTFENGLKLIILPRKNIPVAALVTWADVGGADDPDGLTGIAHMFEHMAFKGTSNIGTKNFLKEKELLDKEDEIYNQILLEKSKGFYANQELIASLTEQFKLVQKEALNFSNAAEFTEILQKEGGVGLNAFTSRDQTAYTVKLPVNKIELWMALESERFLDPVLREMYKEKDVVAEERRMSVENNPIGKLYEEFLCTAFKAHPYGRPLIGHMADILNYSREKALEFYKKYYIASNLVVSIVGDVEPQKIIEMAKKYWGRLPAKPKPVRYITYEPPQQGEKRVTIEAEAQPMFVIGWHVPQATHNDRYALDALCSILGDGRTSRLYRKLVRDLKIASYISAYNGYPGSKYPSLAIIACVPSIGKSNEECEMAIYEEIEKIKNEFVTDQELKRFKTKEITDLVRRLDSNMEIAQLLAKYQQIWGDWRALFKEVDKINSVTKDQIKYVANKYFTKQNRTVAQLIKESK